MRWWIGERSTITGLDQHTGDKAWLRGRFYSDKLPGYPDAGDAALCDHPKWAFHLPPHPLGDRPREMQILAGRLLGHAGNIGPAHGLDRGPAGGAGPRPGLHARRLCAGRPGLRPLDARVCLRNARLRPPGVGLRPPGVILADPSEVTAIGRPPPGPGRVPRGARPRSSSSRWPRCRRSWDSTCWRRS